MPTAEAQSMLIVGEHFRSAHAQESSMSVIQLCRFVVMRHGVSQFRGDDIHHRETRDNIEDGRLGSSKISGEDP